MKAILVISYSLLSFTFPCIAQNINLNSGNYIMLHSPTDGYWKFGKDNDHHINVYGYGDGNRRFRILNGFTSEEHFNVNLLNGRTGIGTATPSAKLHVIGGGGINVDLVVAGRLTSDNADGGLWCGSGNTFVGGHQTNKIGFWNQGWRMSVLNNGNVGIGTLDPTSDLSIESDGTSAELRVRHKSEDPSFGIVMRQASDLKGKLECSGREFQIEGGWDKNLILGNVQYNNYGGKILIPGGSVAIGTDNPQGYKLAVAGKAVAEEVVVKLKANWPDYVFSDEYALPSLSSIERYIKEHKHLPDVPTEAEVKENGVSVGEMNAILLKKIEELTLHLIRQQKEIDELKSNQK